MGQQQQQQQQQQQYQHHQHQQQQQQQSKYPSPYYYPYSHFQMKQNSVSPNNNLLHSGMAPPFDSSSNQYLHNHLHPSPYFGNTNVQDIPKNSNNIGHDAYPRIVKTEINDHIVNYMATGSKRKLLFSKKKRKSRAE